MDFRRSPGRTAIKFSNSTSHVGNKGNVYPKQCTKSVFIRRGRKLVRKTGYRTSSSRTRGSRILFNIFHCSKEGRRTSSNIESSTIKQIPKSSALQDGNAEINYSRYGNRRLGGSSRFEGRIPSHSNLSATSEISQILHRKSTFPVQSNALRPRDSAQSVYEGHGSGRRLPPHERSTYFHVPGRLVTQKQGTNVTSVSSGFYTTPSDGSRTSSESREVSHMAISNDNLSWSRVQSTKGHCMPDRGSLPEPVPGNIYFIPGIFCSSQIIPSNFGSDGFMHRLGTTWETTHAAHPVVSSMPLVSEKGQYFSPCSGQESTFTTPTVVDSEVQHFQGSMSRPDTSTGNNVDRCLQSGLGCSSGHSEYFRDLVPNTDIGAHQCSRDVSGSECLVSFREISGGENCVNQERQLDCGMLHKSPGWNQVSTALYDSLEYFPVVSEQEYFDSGSPHSGKEKFTGGQLVEGECESESHRMEFESLSCGNAIQHLHKAKHRSVCDKGESQNSDILLPLSGSGGMELRRSSLQLDRDVCVRISSPDSDSTHSPEGESRILCPTISSTSLTETIVVSNTSQSFDRHANTSTKHRVSTDSKKRSGKTSRSAKPKVSSMENIRRYKATEKFSERAKTFITNSKRESTRKVYDARLTIYRNWCSARSVSPHSISVSDLAEFFIYLHDVRNCKATTIAGYRSAIASVHKGWHNSTVSNNVSLSNLIKGMFNSNPSVKTLLPNWDLPPVLMSLCDTPFEPLSTCEMKFLTWKTVFLVALATASRVSEIHALSLDSQHLRFEKDGIRLLPNLKFLAKTQRLGKPWSAMFVPEFNTYATDCRDLLLCPCRAVKMYLKRTKSLRKGEEALFLTYKSGQQHKASKHSIARWIVSLIQFACEKTGKTLLSARAHDTRRLSTSWALFNGASVEEIIRAAHWAGDSTFTSFYMRDVPSDEARFARCSILDTLHAAKRTKKRN